MIGLSAICDYLKLLFSYIWQWLKVILLYESCTVNHNPKNTILNRLGPQTDSSLFPDILTALLLGDIKFLELCSFRIL